MKLLSAISLVLLLSVACMGQNKPYDITENDPEFLDRVVDKIYERVRDRVDSLVNGYIDTDSGRAISFGLDTIWSNNGSTPLRIKHGRVSIRGTDFASIKLWEQLGAGSESTELKGPNFLSSNNVQTFQDATGTVALTSDTWSRAGDTLVQSGRETLILGQNLDTIPIPVSFASTDYYVVLDWMTDPPSPDTLRNILSGGNQFWVDSFVVKYPDLGAGVYSFTWIAVGN